MNLLSLIFVKDSKWRIIMNASKTVIVAGSLLVNTLLSQAIAGDDPVNCRNEVVETPVYYGYASCRAYNGQQWVTISRYISQSSSPTIYLSEGSRACFASLPSSYNQTISRNVCDYTPQAGIRKYISYDGTAYTAALRLSSAASDRDGSIVKTEWWVNGAYYGTSVPTFTVTSPTSFSIRQKVTDNQGLTDETTTGAFVSPRNDPCREGESSC